MTNVYLRHLALNKKVHGSGRQLPLVDQGTKRLFEVVALSYAQNRPLTVAAPMALEPSTTLDTKHRKFNLWRTLRQIYKDIFFYLKN